MSKKKEDRKQKWLRANFGVLSRLASRLNLSKQYVGEVFWGKKSSAEGRVEKELGKVGAPGFDSPLPDPAQARHYADLALDLIDLPSN